MDFIDRWGTIKAEIKRLESVCAQLKQRARKTMDAQGINSISGSKFRVIRKTQHTSRMVKKHIPQDVWDRYATITSSDNFYVKKKVKLIKKL